MFPLQRKTFDFMWFPLFKADYCTRSWPDISVKPRPSCKSIKMWSSADIHTIHLMWFPQWLGVQDECLSCSCEAQHTLFQSNPCLLSGLLRSNDTGNVELRSALLSVSFISCTGAVAPASEFVCAVFKNQNPSVITRVEDMRWDVRYRGHLFILFKRGTGFVSMQERIWSYFQGFSPFLFYFED